MARIGEWCFPLINLRLHPGRKREKTDAAAQSREARNRVREAIAREPFDRAALDAAFDTLRTRNAALQSATRSTTWSPTLEPWRTGLSTTGGFQPRSHGVPAASTTVNRAVGTPAAAQRCLVSTLSNPMRLASASQPV